MDDETILARGGDERDIEEYAKQHGADLTKEDVEREEVIRFWNRTKLSLTIAQQERIKTRVISGWNLRRAISNEGVIVVASKIETKGAQELFKEGILTIDKPKEKPKTPQLTPNSLREGVEIAKKQSPEAGEVIGAGALCVWCGKKYEQHEDARAEGQPQPRVPCLALKSGFKQ